MFPIYIPSKGRPGCLTARLLADEGLPFRIAVEGEEVDGYAARYGPDRLLPLPFDNLKQGAAPARNFIKATAKASGFPYHWQLDDDMRGVYRYSHGKGTKISLREALETVETFVGRFENIGIAGITSRAFAFSKRAPFQTNIQVYGMVLVRNDTPFLWRSLGEDTDYSIQVLSAGLCTVLFNAIAFETTASGTTEGGNRDTVYAEDGRLRRAKQLQAFWPDLGIQIRERWGRPFQDLNQVWRRFTTELKPPRANPWAGLPEYFPRPRTDPRQERLDV